MSLASIHVPAILIPLMEMLQYRVNELDMQCSISLFVHSLRSLHMGRIFLRAASLNNPRAPEHTRRLNSHGYRYVKVRCRRNFI